MNKFYYLILFCFLFSCVGKKNENSLFETGIGKVKDSVTVFTLDSADILQKEWNDLAAFISGSSLKPNNRFYSFSQAGEWTVFHQKMDSIWSEFQLKTENIKTWQQEKVSQKMSMDTVFYPFSGPDFPYLSLFYPDASYYYLLALEPVGTVDLSPQWENVSDVNMKDVYMCYFNAIFNILSVGYFKTNDMQEEFSSPLMDGVFPILLLFLNRMNFEILSISTGNLDKNGLFSADSVSTRAVEIVFRKKEREEIKKLCYITCNLSNRGIRENESLRALLSQKDFTVLIKSASYLMHNAGFWQIKHALLSNAKLIIQDDSGIPYSDFSPLKWDINLFGRYSKPIFLFRRYFQESLANTYKDSTQIKPMDFCIGYGQDYNLLIATRK